MRRWVLSCLKRLINRSIMMDFSLTEEQELLLASIRELITTNFPEEYFRT
ncbi:acyl-CoA dehydrogenase, partial [Escherichia coli]